MSDSDPQTPTVEGQANRSTHGNSNNHHEPPSSDFLASVHSVEVENDDHREQRSLNFYQTDTDKRIRPGDTPEVSGRWVIPRKRIEALDADPSKVFTAHIRPDANLPAEPGSTGVFEKVGNGRVRFLGTTEDLGGERIPLDG